MKTNWFKYFPLLKQASLLLTESHIKLKIKRTSYNPNKFQTVIIIVTYNRPGMKKKGKKRFAQFSQ